MRVTVVDAVVVLAMVAKPDATVQLTKWLFVSGVARIAVAVAVFSGFASVNPAVPFPVLLTVKVAVLCAKFAVIVLFAVTFEIVSGFVVPE